MRSPAALSLECIVFVEVLAFKWLKRPLCLLIFEYILNSLHMGDFMLEGTGSFWIWLHAYNTNVHVCAARPLVRDVAYDVLDVYPARQVGGGVGVLVWRNAHQLSFLFVKHCLVR